MGFQKWNTVSLSTKKLEKKENMPPFERNICWWKQSTIIEDVAKEKDLRCCYDTNSNVKVNNCLSCKQFCQTIITRGVISSQYTTSLRSTARPARISATVLWPGIVCGNNGPTVVVIKGREETDRIRQSVFASTWCICWFSNSDDIKCVYEWSMLGESCASCDQRASLLGLCQQKSAVVLLRDIWWILCSFQQYKYPAKALWS